MSNLIYQYIMMTAWWMTRKILILFGLELNIYLYLNEKVSNNSQFNIHRENKDLVPIK